LFIPAIVLVALGGTCGGASAMPKQSYPGQCTAKQIQSPEAGPCINQMEDDVRFDRPTTHFVYCSSDGHMLCCEYDRAGNVVDQSCQVIAHVGHRPGVTYTPPAGLSQGGWAPPPRPGGPGRHGGSGSAYPVAPPPPGHHRQPITGIQVPNRGLKLPGNSGGGAGIVR